MIEKLEKHEQTKDSHPHAEVIQIYTLQKAECTLKLRGISPSLTYSNTLPLPSGSGVTEGRLTLALK